MPKQDTMKLRVRRDGQEHKKTDIIFGKFTLGTYESQLLLNENIEIGESNLKLG